MEDSSIGKYEVIAHVGRGATAAVFKALHPELNRVVAIKVLDRSLMHSPEMRARFRREARAIAALRHANIVQVFDFDIVDDAYYMVMEYIEGGALNQRLAELRERGERMSLQEALRVVVGVGKALHYAHEQGMLHRDVKPGNIMFRGDGSVVLTDFGVAKILNVSGEITATGAVAGTPAYMAPEQWTDNEPDRRSDIYSLGVVLYELATGALPFDDETPGRLMFRHISEPPPLPRKLHHNIPLDLERVILRALAKDRRDRYQTAQELVDDLEALIYRVESTALTGIFRRPSLPFPYPWTTERSSAPSLARRLSLIWLGVGGVVAIIALIALLVLSFGDSTAPEATPNATGTALAARLTVFQSTLFVTATSSPTPTSSPAPVPSLTPSRTPTPTGPPSVTPSPSPLPSPLPVVCSVAASLEEDVNYYNENWWNTVDAPFDKTWRLRNGGDCPWPEGIVVVHLDGHDFGLDEQFELPELMPGEEIELSVPLQAPSTPGSYQGRFQLQTSEGEPVGPLLTVELEARQRGLATPTASWVVEPVHFERFDLFTWSKHPTREVWFGKVRLWASGGTGQYRWFRDTLDNPLPGDVLEFEWAVCRDFIGSVWVVSGDTMDHEKLHIPYPERCN